MRSIVATAAMPLLLFILAGTLQLIACQGPEVGYFTRETCKDLPTTHDCDCAVLIGEFDISCPAQSYTPTFKINIRPVDSVRIECNITDINEDYRRLPALKLGKIPRVQIKRCPLPKQTPIAGIMEQLGIMSAVELIFESNDLGMNVTRQHLIKLKNLMRLRFSARRLEYIPEDLLRDMYHLSWLDMRAANLGELPATLLHGMDNLQFLELGSNNLRQIPRGFFRDLKKLSHLNLWSNQLKNLSRDDFEGASSVKDIDLHNNGINELRPDVFALLPNVTEINLNSNNFSSLPAGLFRHNKLLETVKFQKNHAVIKTLPSGLFANLPKLHTLFLHCELQSIPSDLIANSTNLTNISFRNNKLSILPAHLFDHQRKLLTLDLQGNRLTYLPENIFDHLSNLQHLYLASNQLTELPSTIFNKLKNLTTLTLNDNRIATIHEQTFVHNYALSELNMANNQISLAEYMVHGIGFELNSPFASLMNLTKLNLRNNSLMIMFTDWRLTMRQLQYLDLSYNNLTILDYTDLNFVSTQDIQLNLTHNQIRSIQLFKQAEVKGIEDGQRFVNGVKTVHVDLNDNPLFCDCSIVHFVQMVKGKMRLDYAKTLKTTTDRLRCEGPAPLAQRVVAELDPRDLLCKFDYSKDPSKQRCPAPCECHVRTYDYTLIINCANRQLKALPELPELPHGLKQVELNVMNNELLFLPDYYAPGYANVTVLYGAGNNLTHLEINQLPRNLRYLDLRENQLQNLNESVIIRFNSSNNLQMKLSNNSWVCDCAMKPLLLFVLNNPEMVEDRSDIYCTDSQPQTRLVELSGLDLCPHEKNSLLIAIIVIISLTGFLIGITFALYYKFEPEIKIWCYSHGIFMWFVTEEEIDKDKKFDAFISYSHKDSSFIEKYLHPQLELGSDQFKLCLHERDWEVGSYIAENIAKSVANSRRTIIVLSQNFIESDWSRMEFRAAHRSALKEGVNRVIVIIYSDIGDQSKLDEELQAYLNTNTYIKWGDPWFWERLRYALPHRGPRNRNGALTKTPLKGSTDDKMELTRSPVTPPLTTPPGETTKNPLVAQLNGKTPHTAIMIPNGKNGLANGLFASNGKAHYGGNGHINEAYVINTNAKQSDV